MPAISRKCRIWFYLKTSRTKRRNAYLVLSLQHRPCAPGHRYRATKRAEGNHGADWEWWLVHGNKGLGFRVQAKRTSQTAATKAFLPKNTVQTRTSSSTSSSSSAGVEPLYCFFNFPHPQAQFNGPSLCKHTHRAPSIWGCSLAFPDQVKKAKSTQITNLKPIMHPWHMLVCESAKNDLSAQQFSLLVREAEGIAQAARAICQTESGG
jgi:hypothetical protein